jgi:hypothetical protein
LGRPFNISVRTNELYATSVIYRIVSAERFQIIPNDSGLTPMNEACSISV